MVATFLIYDAVLQGTPYCGGVAIVERHSNISVSYCMISLSPPNLIAIPPLTLSLMVCNSSFCIPKSMTHADYAFGDYS